VARLEDRLPDGLFDLVVSALAVHHLDGAAKADLCRRVGGSLARGGRLVIGDVVVPPSPRDQVTPINADFDTPSTVDDYLSWLAGAGLRGWVAWSDRDLAVLVAETRHTSRYART